MNTIAAIRRRPGKLWTFLQFPVTRIIVAAAAVVIFIVVIGVATRTGEASHRAIADYLAGFLLIVGTCAVYAAYVRLIERRSVTELGTRGALQEFGRGLLTGAALFCLVMLILWGMHVLRIGGVNSWYAVIYPLIAALTAGFTEEILMRGVLFRIIEESLGSWLALAISAATFGLLHAFNPGASLMSTAAIALEAGILLAAVYMYTRRLWMVIGLHAGWNFAEGGLFGASVSGGGAHGLFSSQFQGASLLTGGKFGPEASVVAVLVCLAAGIGFIFLAYRKGQIVRPVWRRAEEMA